MRINAVGGLFRGYCDAGFGGNKAGISSPFEGHAKSDQLTLSKQALSLIQMQSKIREIEQAKENAENCSETHMLESMKKAMDVLKTCSTIAARVRAGDKVPLKDLRYLMDNDPQGYQLAMASRKPKVNPKEWKSAIPEEKQEERKSDGDGSTEVQADGVQTSPDAEGPIGMSSSGTEAGTEGGV